MAETVAETPKTNEQCEVVLTPILSDKLTYATHTICFSHDEKLMFVDEFTDIVMYDTEVACKIRTITTGHSFHIFNMNLSKDGMEILTASGDGSSKIIRWEDGACLHTFKGDDNDNFESAVFSSTEEIVYVACQDKLKAYVVKTGECMFSVNNRAHELLISSDDAYILMPGDNNSICIFDAKNGALHKKTHLHKADVGDIKWIDPTHFASAAYDNTIAFHTFPDCEIYRTFKCDGQWQIPSVSIHPSGIYFASRVFHQGMKIWRHDRPNYIHMIDNIKYAAVVVFSPSGKFIAHGAHDGSFTLYTFKTPFYNLCIENFNYFQSLILASRLKRKPPKHLLVIIAKYAIC